jgi:hypothetical protein
MDLIQIKDSSVRADIKNIRSPSARGREVMLPKTYAFHIRVDGQSPAFQPLLCATDAEALDKARQWLAQHPECEEIDVFLGDVELFSVARASGNPPL